MKNEESIIFGLSTGKELAKNIAQKTGVPMGEIKKSVFADGETLIKSTESVRNKNVFVVQSTCKMKSFSVNDTIMELLLFVDSLKRANAKSINLIIPYFGYSRQDRKCEPREPISAKLMANLLEKAGCSRITILDLHSSQIQGFFDIPVDDLPPNPLFIKYINQKYKNNIKDIVIVAPDQGAAKKCVEIAKTLNVSFAIIDKDRIANNTVKILGFMGDVENKIAIIVDDIIDTAGTITEGAKLIKQKGKAREIVIAASHGLLNGDAIQKLDKDYIDHIVITNSLCTVKDKKIPKMDIIGIEEYISEVIKAWISGKSVGKVFSDFLKKSM